MSVSLTQEPRESLKKAAGIPRDVPVQFVSRIGNQWIATLPAMDGVESHETEPHAVPYDAAWEMFLHLRAKGLA